MTNQNPSLALKAAVIGLLKCVDMQITTEGEEEDEEDCCRELKSVFMCSAVLLGCSSGGIIVFF